MFQAAQVRGTCRVICFSPRHDLTLPEMTIQEIKSVVETWIVQTQELGEKYQWVQVFENKGAVMGSSNPHPHGQIWAMDTLPNQAAKEDYHQREYLSQNNQPLLVDYLTEELREKTRIVLQNKSWVVVVPFWAVWPFETLLLPHSHIKRLPDLNAEQQIDLAKILKESAHAL